MRNLLALVGAATVTFVALGWYLDWYKVERQAAPAGYQRLQVDLNPKKIGDDVQAGIEHGAEVVSQLRNKPADTPSVNVPNPALPPAAQLPAVTIPADSGWRPINSTPPTKSPAGDTPRRFDVRPLPSPR